MALRQLLDVPAPAKLNLFLHVVGRRADGYHLLQSVFTLIDWCDTLHFEKRNDGRIRRQDLEGNPAGLPAEDLIVRAARALQAATGCRWGADITLHKQLPTQAGLGGGSSDAASTLLALNRLWGLRLDAQALCRIGLPLGADVPFFIHGHNAWVEGIGEQLTPLHLPHTRFIVIKPPAGASTPQIFQHLDLKRDTKRATIEGFVADSESNQLRFGCNDLQPVAERLCPDITKGLQWLQTQGLQGRMTGSGSALFAPVQSDVDTSCLPAGWVARHCNNLREHPLIEWR
ncbi:4-diphosphocytidyl-2-C-methyl-D-erythritol kinase [Tepidicella xavieri]|uniref:4-diphosphocytidyl-2-C-methyl-D-erythritol kinase n=1 Tax=Tepidicella xavieri TaxID=360241 RepID=A0A4R6UD43_9BURK|nr:4-diphosphocytidyl-2-C-methyl-D-erythritol kinase [Tepidicella xavieri]